MSVLYLAVPVALLLAAVAVGACIWAIRNGQYEDLDTPAVRMLFDEPEARQRLPDERLSD